MSDPVDRAATEARPEAVTLLGECIARYGSHHPLTEHVRLYADGVENERDGLRRQVAAVEALAGTPDTDVLWEDGDRGPGFHYNRTIRPQQIRDALAAAAAVPVQPETVGHRHEWGCKTCDATRNDPIPLPSELAALTAVQPEPTEEMSDRYLRDLLATSHDPIERRRIEVALERRTSLVQPDEQEKARDE